MPSEFSDPETKYKCDSRRTFASERICSRLPRCVRALEVPPVRMPFLCRPIPILNAGMKQTSGLPIREQAAQRLDRSRRNRANSSRSRPAEVEAHSIKVLAAAGWPPAVPTRASPCTQARRPAQSVHRRRSVDTARLRTGFDAGIAEAFEASRTTFKAHRSRRAVRSGRDRLRQKVDALQRRQLASNARLQL